MIKVGMKFKPYSARVAKGGEYTSFALPQNHRNPNGNGLIPDGFINLLVKGEYNFERGDIIKVLKIDGAELRNWNGRQFFSVYGEIEYTPASVKLSEPNQDILDGDIPEEML